MTRAHPLLGLGPGSFALYHQDYQHDRDPSGADDPASGRLVGSGHRPRP